MSGEMFLVGGAKGHLFEGIFFSEGSPDGAQTLGQCAVQSNVQNTNLETLKRSLAQEVKRKGGNSLINFRYAQKATVWSFSSVRWNASGDAARLESIQPPPSNDSVANTSSSKRCPYCAEEILVEAKKCKHCGEMLEPLDSN